MKTLGLRERKRQETSQRIAEAGMRLFRAKGFDTTTIDEIAAEAEISRRTFFYYFATKDDILLHLQSGMGEMIAKAIMAQPIDQRPMEAARNAVLGLPMPYPPEELLEIDRVMRSSDTVQARKQASYIHHELTVLAALRDGWPEKDETALRVVAMLVIGTIRISTEEWSEEGGIRPLTEVLRETFDKLRAAV